MTEPPDYLAMIDSMQPWREMLRGMVAMLVADGFTDEESRALTAAAMTTASRSKTEVETTPNDQTRYAIVICPDCVRQHCGGHVALDAINAYAAHVLVLTNRILELERNA